MNLNRKLSVGIAVLFEIILLVSAIMNISFRQWKNLSLTLLAALCLGIPFIITYLAEIKKIVLPSSFEIIILIFVFLAQYFGEIRNFYGTFWWWDLLLHAIFGSYVVVVGHFLLKGTMEKTHKITKQRFVFFKIMFAFCFAITLGTLWEIFEFAGDYIFRTSMIKGGLNDTLTDLIIKTMAALITSIVYYIHCIKKPLKTV